MSTAAKIADSGLPFPVDVLETLRAIEWSGSWDGGCGATYKACPFCNAIKPEGQHTEDCRVMLLIRRAEALQ